MHNLLVEIVLTLCLTGYDVRVSDFALYKRLLTVLYIDMGLF